MVSYTYSALTLALCMQLPGVRSSYLKPAEPATPLPQSPSTEEGDTPVSVRCGLVLPSPLQSPLADSQPACKLSLSPMMTPKLIKSHEHHLNH